MSTVEKIKERLSIEEVIGHYIKLEKAGINLKARCPFHNEKTPSFFVSPTRGGYYCFGCGAKGDIFTFVQEFEKLDFRRALELLAERAGVQIETIKNTNNESALYRVMNEAALFFEGNLAENKEARVYLHSRGLTEQTIKKWRLGYARSEWRSLTDFLKTKGYGEPDILGAGLAKRPDEGGGSPYDRFRSRITFPLFDTSGRIIAFSGRIFPHDDSAAKYLNSPETEIFNKSQVLYGLNDAKMGIRKFAFVIVVEGQMDLLMCHQSGFNNAVATSGTALTENHLNFLRRFCTKIIFAYDADRAGIAATLKGAEMAQVLGFEVKIATMPKGYDPAETLKTSGVEKFKEIIKNSSHLIAFKLQKILDDEADSRKRGKRVFLEVLPMVASLQSHMEQQYFVKIISERLGIKEDHIWEDLKKVSDPEEQMEIETVVNKHVAVDKRVMGVYFWLSSDSRPEFQNFAEALRKIVDSSYISMLENKFDHEKEQLIFEAEALYHNEKLNQHLSELLLSFEEDYIKQAIEREMNMLLIAEKNKDDTAVAQILKTCQNLNNRLSQIKILRNN